jgi:hypothetical protein
LPIRERDPKKWFIRTSTLFDAAYDKRAAHSPRLAELLFLMLDELEFDPRRAGRPHPKLELWVYESVTLAHLPRIFVL